MSSESTVRVPQQARSIEKRKKLVDAGMHLFGEKGYQGANAKEIAKVAGVSVGTFYAYFKDKKALLIEILGQHMHEVDNTILAELELMIRDRAPGREIMQTIVRLSHNSHHHSPDLLRVMLSLRYSDEDIARYAEEDDWRLNKRIVALLEQFGDRLRVTDLEAAAVVVANAMEETTHKIAVSTPPVEAERLYDALADMVAAYLFKDPDAAG